MRDRTRDIICDDIRSLGIDARMAERGCSEERFEKGYFSQSLGLVEIFQGPVRWINVIRRMFDLHPPTYFLKFGVPDSRLGQFRPTYIKSVRNKRFAPYFGRATNMYWFGDDFDLGIIENLDNDDFIKTLMLDYPQDVHIHAYPTQELWIISIQTYHPEYFFPDLWDCCRKISQHIDESKSFDPDRIKPMKKQKAPLNVEKGFKILITTFVLLNMLAWFIIIVSGRLDDFGFSEGDVEEWLIWGPLGGLVGAIIVFLGRACWKMLRKHRSD